jgi:predicted small metal-binding protein
MTEEEIPVDDVPQFTNRCACGWEVTSSEDDVVEATIDHGRRLHNMEASREQVIAALHGTTAADASPADASPG